ncbi:transcriptional regulator CatR [Pseudocitrobacter faecalis]|uniref:LysR family transcriptional regulator n=1 Tax=Pseudocitrobacter faecalis TaxID=1398493 RepID=UPI001679DD03|nr:LysR family transcriptional regulator [Pseudocitrobacter faecalis]GHD96553.1 transcriptional regulator CatR [Pseudocitrobacter faecalis]
MELRHLRYYQEVCRTLSFSRAAENLHIAQPPLSRQIQQLESQLNVTLITRTRPLALTEAGTYLYQQIEPLFNRLEEIVHQTRQIAHASRARLSIGFAPSMLYGALPSLIRRLHDENDIAVEMQEMVTLRQIDALKKGRIDVGFGRIYLHDSEIEQLTIREEPLVAALPDNHARNGDPISLAELSQQPFILYPAQPRPGYADHTLRIFEQHHLSIDQRQQANDMQTALALVAAGLGVALVPESAKQIHHEGVRYVCVKEPHVTSPIILSYRKHEANPLVERCKNLLRPASGQ